MLDLPAIESLLPHRGTMLLLDRIIRFDGDCLLAEYSPRPHAWYADPAGNMPGWVGIELMAQTVAAYVAMKKRLAGLPPKMGAMRGTRCYQSQRVSVAESGCFAAGRVLQIQAHEDYVDDSGLAAYDCAIGRDGEVLATATLKVYEPADFETFIQGRV